MTTLYLLYATIILLAVTSFICMKFSKKVNILKDRYTLDIMPGKMMQVDGKVNRGEIDWDQSTVERNDIYKESSLFYNVEKISKLLMMVTIVVACFLIGLSVFGTFQDSEHVLQIAICIGILMVLSELLYMKLAYGKLVQIFEDNEGNSLFELCKNQINH